MTSILIDDDLLLRSYRPEDAPELFRVVQESRDHLRPFLNWVDGTTRPEHSLQFIQNAQIQQNTQQALPLGIFLNQRELIGGIGLHSWDHSLARGQMGYWISKLHEGTGLMSRSAVRFIDFLFKRLDLNKLEMHIIPHNTRSLALAARLGALNEGTIRQSIKVNGLLEDVIVTGILKSEWTLGL